MGKFPPPSGQREITLTTSEVIIALEDGNTFALLHRDLIWFVRELIDHIESPEKLLDELPTGQGKRKRHYRREIQRALDKLDEEIDEARLDNLIAKSFVRLLPAERGALTLAIEKVWLPRVAPSKVGRLLERAHHVGKIKALRAPEDKPIAADGFARLLGLRSGIGSHIKLAEFCGDYLIFRRLSSASTLVVAHLNILQDPEARYPASFVTRTSVPESSGPRASVVRGVVYEPDDVPDILFATGKYLNTKQLRTTILRPTRKLDESCDHLDLDIEGIRLGISRSQRWPVAYIIWCSRIRERLEWEAIARAYAFRSDCPTRLADDLEFKKRHGLDPHQFLSSKVVGFEKIMERLTGKSFLALDQGGLDDE